jgi:hypothetical protein
MMKNGRHPLQGHPPFPSLCLYDDCPEKQAKKQEILKIK